ncbi:MAG: lytic transglycosylase domain-containing protein [Rhodobacteraceae bacterium]|nr:lytic transglycosylase domain-containing protein [Paracoccaceae bacterium]
MFKYLRLSIAALVWLLLAATPSLAQSEAENGATMAEALAKTSLGDWDGAKAIAGRIPDPVAGDIIEWIRLRDGGVEAPWSDYRRFLADHANWPGLELIRSRAEAALPANSRPADILAFFETRPPDTGIGVLRLIEAYQATGRKDEAIKLAIATWTTFSMTKDERVQLYGRFEKTLEKHNVERLDMLLWRDLGDQAEALYELVPEGYPALAKARLGLRARVAGVDGLIAAVPAALKDDPGLNYERFLWRSRKGLYDSARDLMLERSTSAAALGRPEEWSERRRAYARQEMRDGNNARAYQLATRHFLTEGSDYADLEWLAGYIALRKLNDPSLALKHFHLFQTAVGTPISDGRAGYWLGRAYEALGDAEKAKLAYTYGAVNQTSFYGQLAAEKINAGADLTLTGREASPDWRTAGFDGHPVLRAAMLFHYADQPWQTERFIRHFAESQDRTGLQQLAELAIEIGRPQIAVRLSKQAAGMGYVLPKTYFPVTDLARRRLPVDPEVAMSIARRESELDQQVISPAGARGLMQLMPGTARKMSKELGLTYSVAALTDDWSYNATLGSAYLAQQLQDFGGSYILAFVAYNAGPSRARQWIERYGDPRGSGVDQVDWIEHIPFRETRNYVMRVMESLHVYRARISGKVPDLRLSKDLRKG